MANMSYCRFENTYGDLKDCYEALSEKEINGLSADERRYALKLIVLCGSIADEFYRIILDDVTPEEAADAGA